MLNKNLLKTLGPGILFASTCIGVSHLVQSTRAGANYGFSLVIIILLANLFKYPFFEYGSRYANATGTSIIDGYRKLGKWAINLYALITLGTMFFVTAAVVVVTSGFMNNLFGISELFTSLHFPYPNLVTPILLLTVCFGILAAGKYNVLDSLIKVIGGVLLISTLIAFILSVLKGGSPPIKDFVAPDWLDFNYNNGVHLGFIVALMGWMPTALDLSTWNSLWTVARIKQTGYKPTLKETLFDFNFGYIVSVILAICFVTLGANLMYGSGETLPSTSSAFSAKIVQMYTTTMGDWSKWIIGPAAFSIMFGTAIAVIDGYARSSERILEILFIENKKNTVDVENRKRTYVSTILILSIVSFIIGYLFVYNKTISIRISDFLNELFGNSIGGNTINGFKFLVDIATTISFIVAPIMAIMNFRLVQEKYVGKDFVPPKWEIILSYAGITFLSGFSILFLIFKFL
jgi:Mn2+/Fe2+ NRAMP family transporter